MAVANAISLTGLGFRYGKNEKPVLSIADLQIPEGKRVFLAGPSGSGKTTLLGIIAGILSGYDGSLEIFGQSMNALHQPQRDRFRGAMFGYIFQMFNLLPYLNVAQNIAVPCRLNPVRAERLQKPLAEEIHLLAQRLEIDHLLKKSVLELSVGQQQRVAAARALIGRPPLVIADEPTSALDTDLREKFIELLLQEVKENKQTLLFVSHDLSLKKLFDQSLSLSNLNQVKANA